MADSSRVIIKNSHVIDATSQEPRELTVVVEDSDIVDLLPPGSPVSSGDAQEIDLRGSWLLPGLWTFTRTSGAASRTRAGGTRASPSARHAPDVTA